MKTKAVALGFFILLFAVNLKAQDEISRAREFVQKGQNREAISVLQSASRSNPLSAEGLFLMAKAYHQASISDSTEIWGNRALVQNRKNPELYAIIAEAQAKQGKTKEAYETLRQGLKNTRDDASLLVQLGFLQLEQDSTEKAIVSFSKAREVQPENLRSYIGLAKSYEKLGSNSMAVKQYEKALELEPERLEFKHEAARLYQADRRYNDAVRLYKEILDAEPTNDAAAIKLGQLYCAAGQYGNAAVVLEPYVERHPDDQDALVCYLDALSNSRKCDSAIIVAGKVLNAQPDNVLALRALGKCQHLLKNYAASIEAYEKLLKMQSDVLAEDLKFLGRDYQEMKNDPLAIQCLEQSLQLDSTQTDIFSDLGASYMRLRNWQRAVEMYEQRIKVDPNQVGAYVNFALSNMAMQRWEAAQEALKAFLELQPNYLPGHLNLARCLAQMDSFPQAKKEYEKVIELAGPSSVNYRAELAEAYKMISRLYLVEKDYPKAVDALTNAVVYKPDDAELHLWRAQTLHALDQREEAEKEYNVVLKLDPDNKDAKRGLEILALYN